MPLPEHYRDRPYAAEHFQRIVAAARATNPFYARFIPDPEHVPILDRRTFLEHNDEILNGNPVTARTSGSTGVPVRISHSTERLELGHSDTVRFVQWLGGPLTVTRIIHPPDGEPPDWLLDVQAPLDEQLDRLVHRWKVAGAVAVTTYPTNAEALAHAVLERGLDMTFVRRFGCYGEVFEPHQMALVRRAFPRAQVWSTYSAMEFDLIAAMCPHEPPHHHVMAHKLGLEVLDERGLPCAPGELGRLVVTDYFNTTCPFIRYEIGDLAVRGDCPCGRIKLPALERVVGKVRGALVHRDGRRVLFTELSVALRDLRGMKQYQVIQEALDDFVVRVVVANERRGPALEAEIAAVMARHFGYHPHVTVRYESHIEREPSGKFHASISKVSWPS